MDGTSVSGRELRDQLGADADLVLQLSYASPEALRAAFAPPAPPAAPAAPSAPAVPQPEATPETTAPPEPPEHRRSRRHRSVSGGARAEPR